MPNDKIQSLSDTQISNFIEHGFIRLDDAFPPELAVHVRSILWRAMALSPDDPKGWTRPIIRLGMFADPPFAAAANTPRLHTAYDALVGKGRWLSPTGLGTFPIRFPSTADPGDSGWHVDVSFATENADFMQWRVNIVSKGRALLMLFLFSDVEEADAPTRIRVGSHARIARQLLPHGAEGLTLAQLASDGFAGTSDCHEALATGSAGTVYLCHPFLVHAAQPHRGKTPRFLAQPPLLPVGDFDPHRLPSPVQIAIRQACNLGRQQ